MLAHTLQVGPLHNRIHWAGLLAEATVDALSHIDVVARGPPAAILTLLCLNIDGLSRADGLAELARDAALLPSGIPAQGVLSPETRRQGGLLEGVVDGDLLVEEGLESERQTARNVRQEEGIRVLLQQPGVRRRGGAV